MALTAALELHPEVPVNPDAPDVPVLFTSEAGVPFGWYLFFAPEDLTGGHSLQRPVAQALSLARARLKSLQPLSTPRLQVLLRAFITSIAASGKGTLVLDARKLDAPVGALTAPLAWLAAVAANPSLERLEEGEDLFGADDEGLCWEALPDEDPEADEPVREDAEPEALMDYVVAGHLTGWADAAQKVTWEDDEPSDDE
jgi:hypothetical protein